MMEAQNWEDFTCLHPTVITTLQEQGFQTPTQIQTQVFNNYKHYFDFLIASQTGSGKTLSFAAPIVSELLTLEKKITLPGKVMCLVLTPTRQLAQQIEGVLTYLLKDTTIRQASVFGGLAVVKQLRVLHEKSPQIIVGTPGRIQELLQQEELDFEYLKYLVIDEADRMIEMGHYMQLDKILHKIFAPKMKETFESDFQEITKKLDEKSKKDSNLYIMENGKKKKISVNLHSIATDQLFEVPFDMFDIQGETQQAPKPNKTPKEVRSEPPIEHISPQQKQIIQRMKRRIFFISATLTQEFKGTKYFTKRNKEQNEDKDKKKGKKRGKNEEGEFTPKLKALLSRVKFDAKPKIIDLSSQIFLPAKLRQLYCFCEDDLEKMSIIICYIESLQPGSKCIIFSNTIRASRRVKFFMDSAGLRSVALHSHMMQKQRLEKLQKFKKSNINILISTDVAARGLDFQISNVIQFSVPINGDTYVHRAGRTARANRSGEALILISKKQATRWQQICNIITTSDPNRKAQKYRPLQSKMAAIQEKVKQFEWIRRNQQKIQDRRLQKMNEMDAQELGVEAESSQIVKKVNQMTAEQERLQKIKIERQIKKIKQKGKERSIQQEVGDGKVWRKNKLVMSIDEIKKFL